MGCAQTALFVEMAKTYHRLQVHKKTISGLHDFAQALYRLTSETLPESRN